jgi:hypothetical protein
METWVEDWPDDIFEMLKKSNKIVITKKAKKTGGRPAQGLAIAIDSKLKDQIKINYINSRIVTIGFKDTSKNKYLIIGAYMPTNSKEEYECELAIIDLIIKENRESSN